MMDFDFDRLGDVWRQQPDPEEMARLQRTAAAVGRQARLGQLVDIGVAVAVSLVMILLVLSNPSMPAGLLGAAAILVLLIGQMRQRRHRRVELRALTGSTEDMLDQSVARVEATLKRTRFSLMGMVPGLLLGWVFMNAVTGEPVRNLLPELFGMSWLRLLWTGSAVLLVIGCAVYLVTEIRRCRSEFERLTAMRESYRQERESTGS